MNKLFDLLKKEDLNPNIREWLIKNDLDKMCQGEWFSPGDKSVCDARIADLIFDLNHTRPSDIKAINEILAKIIDHKGNLIVTTPFYAEFGYIKAGKDCFIGNNCSFIDGGGITLGDDVLIAPRVVLASATHPIDAELRATKIVKCAPIKIGNNVWIGSNATILGGVTIGDNSIIGAGSVVTHDIPSNVVAIGSPCRAIKKLTIDKDLKKLKESLEK